MDTRDQLRDDLEPGIDSDTGEAVVDGRMNFLGVAILEPEREQTKGVLERVPARQGHRSEKAVDGWNDELRLYHFFKKKKE